MNFLTACDTVKAMFIIVFFIMFAACQTESKEASELELDKKTNLDHLVKGQSNSIYYLILEIENQVSLQERLSNNKPVKELFAHKKLSISSFTLEDTSRIYSVIKRFNNKADVISFQKELFGLNLVFQDDELIPILQADYRKIRAKGVVYYEQYKANNSVLSVE